MLWLDCQGGPIGDTLLDQMAAFCGLDALGQLTSAEQVRFALVGLGECCLLVWDNAKMSGATRLCAGWRPTLPDNCQVLLTTRDDPGERMWPTFELLPLADTAMHNIFCEICLTSLLIRSWLDFAVCLRSSQHGKSIGNIWGTARSLGKGLHG